jgi:hypothetical protein
MMEAPVTDTAVVPMKVALDKRSVLIMAVHLNKKVAHTQVLLGVCLMLTTFYPEGGTLVGALVAFYGLLRSRYAVPISMGMVVACLRKFDGNLANIVVDAGDNKNG